MDPNSLVKAVVASGCCKKRSNGNNCGTVPKYVSTSAMPPTNNYMYPPQMMLPQQFQYPMFMPMPMPVYQDGGCHHRPPWSHYYDDLYDYGLPPPMRERRQRRRRRKGDKDRVQVLKIQLKSFLLTKDIFS